nr:restriction endonuclease subunit S [Luteimonas sp. MC1895]
MIAGYKQTEIGVVPEEWNVKPLSEVLERARLGGNYPNQDAESDFPLMKMGNIARGVFDVSATEYISPLTTPEAQHRLASGDVLFNTRNTLDLVGKVAIWRGELPVAYYNSNLLRLEFKPSEIASSLYANYWLNTATAVSKLRALATGTTSVAAIYTRDLLGFSIAVPPSSEQSAIAAALGDVDELLAAQDALIAKKRAIKQGAMQELLAGKRRLPGFSGEWEMKPLGELSRIRNQKIATLLVDAGTLCVELENVGQGTGCLESRSTAGNAVSTKYTFQAGDVLFGRLRSYLRKYWLATEPGLCTTEIWPLAVDAEILVPGFLFAVVQTDAFIEAASIAFGTHMPRADWGVIRNFEIQLPNIEEQSAIAEVLSEMDAGITALEAQRAKTAQLKQGMMQALLTGRIRLI